MNDFNVHFFKTTSVKRLCLIIQTVHRNCTRSVNFKTEGEEELLKHMAMETMFGDFYLAERFFGAILLETDLVFMVTNCYAFLASFWERMVENIAN